MSASAAFMFKFGECLFNAPVHGQFHCLFIMISPEVDSHALFGFLVNFECMALSNGIRQVVKVLVLCVLNWEVVHDKGKRSISCFMAKKTLRCGLLASMCLKPLDKIVMGNFPCLFQTMPSLGDPCVDTVVSCRQLVKATVVFDRLGDWVTPESNALAFRQIRT